MTQSSGPFFGKGKRPQRGGTGPSSDGSSKLNNRESEPEQKRPEKPKAKSPYGSWSEEDEPQQPEPPGRGSPRPPNAQARPQQRPQAPQPGLSQSPAQPPYGGAEPNREYGAPNRQAPLNQPPQSHQPSPNSPNFQNGPGVPRYPQNEHGLPQQQNQGYAAAPDPRQGAGQPMPPRAAQFPRNQAPDAGFADPSREQMRVVQNNPQAYPPQQPQQGYQQQFSQQQVPQQGQPGALNRTAGNPGQGLNNQANPAANPGYGAGNQGFGAANQGNPAANQGYPANNQGQSAKNAGYDSGNQGYLPAGNQGQQGYQAGNQQAHPPGQGYPPGFQGNPQNRGHAGNPGYGAGNQGYATGNPGNQGQAGEQWYANPNQGYAAGNLNYSEGNPGYAANHPVQQKEWIPSGESDSDEPDLRQVDIKRRCVATIFDFIAGYLFGATLAFLPFVGRFAQIQLTMAVFLLVRDWLFGGRGIGKNLMGLRVVDNATEKPASIKQSLVRNLTLLGPFLVFQFVALVLTFVPLGWVNSAIIGVINILGFFYVVVMVPVESYRAYRREDGRRYGDELAGTKIVDSDMDFSNAFGSS